jgi:thiamine transport system substrate-binding protein
MLPSSRFLRQRLVLLVTVMLAFIVGVYLLFGGEGADKNSKKGVVRVLSYSAFVNAWGPGPAIAQAFQKEYGIRVEFVTGGDAGLLLQKLELLPADVVLGLDQLTLARAREMRKWREVFAELAPDTKIDAPGEWRHADFLPFDWAPMTFVMRLGELDSPHALSDLLDERFRKSIALEDPRTSAPGLQFLYWVLDEFGVEAGFEYLARLKPSVHSVSASWSSAYGLFSKREAKLVFSYLTSPVYHWVEEKNEGFAPVVFESGHPAQVEYAGVPDSCVDCVGGRLFALFLLRPEIQKIIMEKNYMLPVVSSVASGTPFERLPKVHLRQMKSLPDLLRDREQLLERWSALGL